MIIGEIRREPEVAVSKNYWPVLFLFVVDGLLVSLSFFLIGSCINVHVLHLRGTMSCLVYPLFDVFPLCV